MAAAAFALAAAAALATSALAVAAASVRVAAAATLAAATLTVATASVRVAAAATRALAATVAAVLAAGPNDLWRKIMGRGWSGLTLGVMPVRKRAQAKGGVEGELRIVPRKSEENVGGRCE